MRWNVWTSGCHFLRLLKENAHLLALHGVHKCCRTRYDNADDDEDLSRPFNRPPKLMKFYFCTRASRQDCVSVSVWSQARKTINKVLMRIWDRIIDVWIEVEFRPSRCLHHSYTFALLACFALLYGLVSQNRIYTKLFLGGNKKVFVGTEIKRPHDTSESEKNTSQIYWFTHCAAIIIIIRTEPAAWQLKQVQIYSRFIRWMRKKLDNWKGVKKKTKNNATTNKNFDSLLWSHHFDSVI